MNAVKQLRKRTGLSQSQFANKFDIPVRTIQQWEQGVSSPPSYVTNMLEQLVDHYVASKEEAKRHSIPKRNKWKICIDEPFENCEKIYPIQQRKVRALIDDIVQHDDVREIRIFGSSTTESCHIGSDVDIFVDAETKQNLVTGMHDFEFDLWTNESVDDRLRNEIMTKGVKVYG